MSIPNLTGIVSTGAKFAAVLLLLVLISPGIKANHVLGGNITYDCLGNNQYEFTLDIYIDCFGATDPPLIENLFFFPECSFPFSATIDQVSLTEISDLCITEIDNSSCNGGFIPGTWLVTYSTVITLSNPCIYNVVWSAGDWNYFVNVNNAGFPNAYFETVVDNTLPDCGESVEIASLGVPYYCIGEAASYDIEVDNPENYTLIYSLSNVLTDGGVSVIYEAGYSGTVPIPGITIDANTGLINFTAPNQFGTYAVGILIEMYDGLGNLVGTLLESMCFVVRPCLVAPTLFALPQIQSVDQDGQIDSATEASVCLGGSMCIEVEASNANIFREVLLSTDFESIYPGATFTQTGTNPVTGLLCLTASPAYPLSSVVTITATDDDCETPDTDVIQITINILSSLTTSSTSETICLGDNVQLDVSGDSGYTWNVISGEPIDVPDNFSCADCGNPTVSPSINTIYEVIGNTADAFCNQADTIEVIVALSNMSVAVTNESCLQNDGAINLTVPVGSGNYSYAWSGPNGFSAITQDIAGLDGGNYSVTVSDLALPGCQAVINAVVGTTPAPTGAITNADITICEGDCVDIVFDLSGTSPYDLTLTGAINQVNVPDGHILQVCPLQTTTYTLVSVTDNNAPACTVNVNDQFTVTVLPEVNATFIQPGAICFGGNTNLVLDIDQAGSFNIEYSDGVNTFNLVGVSDGHTINVNPAVTTTYTVTGISWTGNLACPQLLNNAVQVVVNALPQATLLGQTSICAGSQATLTFDLTGTGPFDVSWNDGVNTFTENNINDNATVQVSPGSTTTYCISSVSDSNNPSCTQAVNSCVDVTVFALPSATLSQDAAICLGDQVDISFNLNGQQPFDVSYTVNGAPASLNDIVNGNVLSVSPAVDTEYCLVSITDSNNPACTAQVNDCVDITVQPLPTVDISGNASVCPGDCYDILLNLTGVAPFTVSWEIEDLVTNTTTPQADLVGINNGFLLNACPANTSIIRITGVSDSFNPVCSNAVTSEFNITVNTPAQATLLGQTSICAGSQATLTFDLTGTGPFDVSWNDGVNTFTENNINDNATVQVSPGSTTTYCISSVSDSNNPSCTQAVNSCVDVTVFALPSATLSQDAAICLGDQVDISFNLNGQQPFDVSYTVNGAPASLNDIVNGNVLSVSPAVDTEYCLVSITDSNNPACTAQVNDCVDITVQPLPTADISGNASVCPGDCFDIALNLTGVAPFTVSWEIEDLVTNTTTPQADLVGITNGFLLNVCPANTSIIRIMGVSDSFNPVCSNAVTSEFEIEVQELSELSLQQDVSICEGGSGEIGLVFSNPAAGPWDITLSDNLGDVYNLAGITPADLDQGVYLYTITPQGPLTISITAFSDGSLPCTSFGGDIQVSVEPAPTATIAQDAILCPGTLVDLTLGLPAGGPFDVVYNDGVDDITLSGINDGYVLQVNPIVNTTYTLVSVTELDGALNCFSAINGESATITVVDVPLPSAIDTLCDDTGENFQIVFELTGGDPLTYSVTAFGAGQGTISAGPPYIYTSAEIPTGSTVSFDIEDGNPCTPFTLEFITIECPVLTDAGSMDTSPIEVCDGEAAIAIWNNDGFLDGNDQLMYVLHDNPGESLGLVYEIDCDDSGFNDGDTPLVFGNGVGEIVYGVTYYISAVAGSDDGTNDCVDLNHPDISVAAGAPVVFYETPTATLSGGGVICEGETANLQIDFTGLGPWEFEVAVDGVGEGILSTNDNPYLFDVQAPGDYTILSVANAICTGVENGAVNVVVNPLPTATILSGGEICEGENFDLEINLTGTGPWEIDLVYDEGIIETTQVLNAGISPFIHSVDQPGLYFILLVSDANNCSNDAGGVPVELIVNPAPEATMTNTDVETCDNEGIDLTFELTGEAPWQIEYSIDGVLQAAIQAGQSPFTVFTDEPGVYVLESVTDANSCSGSVSGTFEYTSTPTPTSDAGPDIQVCSEIDALLGTPAIPGISYSWTDDLDNLGLTNQAQVIFNAENNGINPVDYTFTLTVSDGSCSDTDDVIVTVLSNPVANAGPDIQACFNEPVQLSASGGIACVWEANPALDDPSVCNPVASPAVNTEFIVEVEGANGCFDTDTVLVEVGDAIVLQTLSYTPEICFETCEGIIELEAEGGFGNYSFEWIYPDGTTANGANIAGLCSGDYSLTVTDENGCFFSDIFAITELPEYVIQQITSSGSVCFGESNGTIEVVSPEAISFAIDNGPALPPSFPDGYLFEDLAEGTYTITVVNDIGCVASEQVQLGEFPQINLFPSFDEQQACYQEVITFGVFANGGGGGFTYFWLDENGNILGNGTTLDLSIEEPMVVTVYAEDQNGCLSDEAEMEVFFGPPITADISPNPNVITYICEGDQITISADLGGGLGFVAPQWVALSTGQTISNQPSFTITPDDDDFYVLTAVDGCSQPLVDTVHVVVMDTPVVEIGYDVISGCAPLQVELVNLTNELLVDQCLWDFGDGNILAACVDTIPYVFVDPGTYTVSLTVTSSQGCVSSSEMEANVTVNGYPTANFTWDPIPPSNLENIVQIVNQTIGASNYFWDFGDLGQSVVPNPIIELPPIDYGVFPVCLTAISPFGCIDTICRDIVLEGEFLLWVPNAFTPDGDGRNEVFQPIIAGADPNEYVFRIFDRWGQLVFETEILDEPWIGNFNGGDHYVQNDVYIWQIICEELLSGERREFTGHVSLIR